MKNLLKKSLLIRQENEKLYIEGALGYKNHRAKEIWLISRVSETKIKIAEDAPSSNFLFEVCFSENNQLFKDNKKDVYDFYLLVRAPYEDVQKLKLERNKLKTNLFYSPEGINEVEYFIRLGRFKQTRCEGLDPFSINQMPCRLYRTKVGNISFVVNANIKPTLRLEMDSTTIASRNLFISGHVITDNSKIKSAKVIFMSRKSNFDYKALVLISYLRKETENNYGQNRYEFNINVDLTDLINTQSVDEDTYDLFLELKLHDFNEPKLVRVGNPNFDVHSLTTNGFITRKNKAYILNPYFTFAQSNFSLQLEEIERRSFRFLQFVMDKIDIFRRLFHKKDIWIIGEMPYKAQDTGLHFFKYMRENHPKKNIYYVIKKDSPELINVKPYGNILYFKSKKHILYTLMAKNIICSHSPDYLYPIRTKTFKNAIKAKKVFLRHGITGMKNCVSIYGKNATEFETDLFLVSSEQEKEIIVRDYGYDSSEVKITGLSRFDSLFKEGIEVKRQLLIIPTWRNSLVNEKRFLESDFYSRYLELVANPHLAELRNKFSFDIILCLHPNMQKYIQHFQGIEGIKIIRQGQVDVQHLIKESAMMITDYSSVAFDFSFLHKPIVFYQFDRNKFSKKNAPHVDLDCDLPGDTAITVDEVIGYINYYAKNGFRMKSEFEKVASRYIEFFDRNSCDRIYREVLNLNKKWN